jgi:glycosyltransferase involved in cell wall biosynthesis
MPPPTIAVDLRALVREPTGVGVYTLALLRELGGRGTARYLGLAHRPAAAVEGLPGVTAEHQPAPLGVLWQQLLLPGRLARGDIDLFWSPLMILPLRLPVPAVVTVHDLTTVLYPETHRLKVRLSQLPFLRHTVADARLVVTDSQATADDLAFHFPEARGRLRVVPLGVDPEFVPATAEAIAATREELGCPDGFVLYAGTLEPRKNLGLLLDAWEALADETDLPLLLAGGYGWHSGGLVARARGLAPRRVRLLGRLDRDRLVRVFQAATLFVYPSLYEGFGLPAAEALACGVPVAASSSSSLPEVVGDAGLLFDPGDAAACAAAIRRLLAEPALRAELGARGVERSRRFRWERAADAMEAVFGEALRTAR